MNQVDNNQPPLMRPLLVRSSNKLCEDCGILHVSLNRHQYCHECAGNNVDDNDDRMIRDNIIRYHLNTTFRNEEGIRRFSRNEEEDSEIIRNYLRVLCDIDNNDIQNFYLQHEMINNKCNPGNAYFYNMVKIFRYRMEYDDEFIPSTPDAEAIEQPTIEPVEYSPVLLSEAVSLNNIEYVRTLLQHRVPTNLNEEGIPLVNGGRSPIHIAVSNGFIECLELLLYYKADPNIQNVNGDTPLMYIASDYLNEIQNKSEMVTLLLEYGANPNIPNNQNTTPCIVSFESNNLELAERLCTQEEYDELDWAEM